MYLALAQSEISSIPHLLEEASKNLYSVIVVPINYTELPMDLHTGANQHNEYSYVDMLLTPDQWNTKVILQLSDEIDCDSENRAVAIKSEKMLLRDISLAEYLQNSGYTMIRLKSGDNVNLARICSGNIKGNLLVQVPAFNAKLAAAGWRTDKSVEDLEKLQEIDTWHWWNNFRCAADYNYKIKLVLEMNDMDEPDEESIRRWLGEPVEAVMISSDMFIANRSNHPVLRKNWKFILAHFFRAHVNIIVRTGVNNNALKLYSEYLLSIREKFKDTHELQSFEDVLEIPLQPLNDNLDCYTYEIFEKDPVKYKLYQNAIEAALIDRVSEKEAATKLSIIMVLGAGRGPLVRAALNAAEKAKRKVRIYIIEKNPNAIRTLYGVAQKLWGDKDVRIFSKDMREFTPPEKADILVSELLGSFGDNELSPECLDCALKLLKTDGISIPCKSTSFINPIMSSKLYNGVRNVQHGDPLIRSKVLSPCINFECGYVVMLKNVYHIDKPQQLFEFLHPNRAKEVDNSRFKKLSFNVNLDCLLTGIAGYFEAVLYRDIIISINPLTHTQGMSSWFPILFPFTYPITLKKGDTVTIPFWRQVSKQKVWYEWCLQSPVVTHVHNQAGRSCPIYCT